MFTHTLIYKQWLSLAFSPFEKTQVRFSKMNGKGLVTFFLFACVAVAVSIYLVSLYFALNFNMKIKNEGSLLSGFAEEVRKEEFILQDFTSRFAEKNPNVLQSMEKVSAIKYLAPEAVVISRPAANP